MAESSSGFSYISPEKQKKNAARLLILEIIALITVILLILGMLAYLNIIPLNKLISNGVFPVAEDPAVTPAPLVRDEDKIIVITPTAIPGATGDITVTSSNSDYELVLANKEKLVAALGKWGVFGRYYSNQANGATTDVLKKININLVSAVQPDNQYRIVDSGDISTSSKIKFSSDSLTMDVNLSPKLLESNKIQQKDIDNNLTFQILSRLYGITHTRTVENVDFDKTMTSEIIEVMKVGDTFSVRKR